MIFLKLSNNIIFWDAHGITKSNSITHIKRITLINDKKRLIIKEHSCFDTSI